MTGKSYFTFPSADGENRIHAVKWHNSEKEVRGVILLIHGMEEHMGRYEETALYFAGKGFVVAGMDELGHGETAKESGEFGYFCKRDPAATLMRDVRRLFKLIKKEYPDVPFFMIGHSMGSLILRDYIAKNSEGVDGTIFIGTAGEGYLKTSFGVVITRLLEILGRGHETSRFLSSLIFGAYNKRTEKRTDFDWLSTDESSVDAYINDPMCGLDFTVNGYRGVSTLSRDISSAGHLKSLPKMMPMLFISGSEDPVGAYGKGVRKVAESYRKAGVLDVELVIMEGIRHEVLNDIKRDEARLLIYDWIRSHSGGENEKIS